jgi:Ca-activated chloride channel family protein
MKRKTRTLVFMVTLLALALAPIAQAKAQGEKASPESTADRTLAPYFFVRSDDPDTDRLPLKSTQADVKIAGVIADVTVTQVYRNEGRRTLEAIYIFPGSTRAAVNAMRMTVGERVIEAEIMKRQEARKTYEDAKQQGRTASLLEQQRPNVFQMNVANILPGDEIRVVLRYTELIEPEDAVYEFVFPTVVGPRYSNVPASGAPDTERWVENPYLHAGEPSPNRFGLTVDMDTGIPMAQLTSPSHEISVEYLAKNRAHVVVKDDGKAGNKDFVLRYRLAGGQIQTGALLYPGKDENFFLVMMEPPARVQAEAVVPREYIFIVDVSGSMHGFPLDVSKRLVEEMIGGLRPDDLMNVILFAGGSAVLADHGSLKATKENKDRAVAWIRSQHGGGGTELLPALKRALDLPRMGGVSRVVVVATDGYVSVEPQAFELIRSRLGQANLFAFGIGTAVNRHLIEGMARVGRGEPFVVLNQTEAPKQAARFRRYIESPVLTNITMTFGRFKARDVEPAAVPDLFALRPVVVFGKYEGEPSGEIVIAGKTARGDFKKVIRIESAMASPGNSALRLLWARHRIMELSDLNLLREEDSRTKEVTDLGLRYSLLTQYTSFVAVDKVKRADGEIVTVKQPLPMPEGVSDLAVGGMTRAAALPAGLANSLATAAPVREYRAFEAQKTVHKKGESGGKLSTEKIEVRVVEVKGDLARGAVERVLWSRLEELSGCCSKGASGKEPKGGQITYRLLVTADGKVAEVRPVTSTITDKARTECLTKAIRSLTFPASTKGNVEIVITVVCEGTS